MSLEQDMTYNMSRCRYCTVRTYMYLPYDAPPLSCPSPTSHLQLGFCLCVLITTLSDHLPGERRLERFRDTQSSIFKYFNKSLGRIEIVGEFSMYHGCVSVIVDMKDRSE